MFTRFFFYRKRHYMVLGPNRIATSLDNNNLINNSPYTWGLTCREIPHLYQSHPICCSSRCSLMPNKYCFQGSGGAAPEFCGPLQKRSCRDVVCLLVFVCMLGGTGYGTYLAFYLGDPDRLIYGVDSWGNVCGQRNGRIEGVSRSGEDCSDRR